MTLEISNLSVAYRSAAQTVRPLAGFRMRADAGELVLLHGPSGCGKTTLLSAIAGLITPESGSIVLGGTDVVQLRGNAALEHRRSSVGTVFQGFNLLASLTALENVMVPMTIAGVRRRTARRRATELLAEVALGDRTSHRPGQLSGGQQQRVAIARALANDPAVLLADEPTAHLDGAQVAGVSAILRRLADSGRIVIVSTHDSRLDGFADRVVHMTPVAEAAAPSLPSHHGATDPVENELLSLAGPRH